MSGVLQARLDGEELLRNNILLGERRAVEAEKEKAEDEALLKVALLKAAEEDDRELESKVKAKREAQEFREQLLVLMEKEAADNSVRDELIKQADAKFAAKREADEARVIAQRQALLDEVMDTRAAQVRYFVFSFDLWAAGTEHLGGPSSLFPSGWLKTLAKVQQGSLDTQLRDGRDARRAWHISHHDGTCSLIAHNCSCHQQSCHPAHKSLCARIRGAHWKPRRALSLATRLLFTPSRLHIMRGCGHGHTHVSSDEILRCIYTTPSDPLTRAAGLRGAPARVDR